MSILRRKGQEYQPNSGAQSDSENHEDTRKLSLREIAARFLAGTALASIAASGAATAIDKGGAEIEIGGHSAGTRTETVTIPASENPGAVAEQTLKGASVEINQDSEYSKDGEAVGLDEQQKEQISNLLTSLETQLQTLESNGKTPERTTIIVTGGASDEDLDNPNGDLGQSSSMNQNLANERAQLVADELRQQAEERNIPIEIASVSGSETVLQKDQVETVEAMAKKYGVSVHELLVAYNFNTDKVPLDDQERSTLTQLLNNNRSTNIDTTITVSGMPVEVGVCDKVVVVNPEQQINVTKDIPAQDPVSLRLLPVPFYIPRGRKSRGKESDSGNSEPDDNKGSLNASEVPANTQENSGGLDATAAGSEPLRGEIVEDDEPKDALISGGEIAGLAVAAEVPAPNEDINPSDDEPTVSENSGSAKIPAGSGIKSGSAKRIRSIITPQRGVPSKEHGRSSERLRSISGIIGKTAAVAAALALVPIPWFTKAETHNQPPEDDKCTSYSIEQGTIREAHLTTLGLAAYSWITGNKLPQVIDRYVSESPKVTEINKPHTKYEVDQNGNILKTENVPEQSTTKKVRPDISRG